MISMANGITGSSESDRDNQGADNYCLTRSALVGQIF